MTGYVTERWYRAPEIILNWMKYDSKGMSIAYLVYSLIVYIAS